MAKNKKETVEIDEVVNVSKRLKGELEKEFGKGVYQSGEDVVNRQLQIIPWCPSLDMITGGISEGTWLSLSGPPKLGKTNALLKLAANMQKVGKHVFILTPEGRLKRKDVVNVQGLDLSEEKLTIIGSTAEKILTSQDYLSIAERILKDCPGCFILIDSISAMVDERVIKGGLGTQLRGANYQIVSQFIDIVCQYVPNSKAIVAGIVHKIANTSGMGAATAEKACNRWKYAADYQLTIKYVEKWKQGESIIGHQIHWHCASSAVITPYKECTSYLRFGIGLDDVYEIFQYGCDCGLIEKGGSWYTFNFVNDHPELKLDKLPKFQGGEDSWRYLIENPKVYQCLANEVKAYSAQLTSTDAD